MKLAYTLLFTLCTLFCTGQNTSTDPESLRTEINFYTPDSIQIIGDLYQADKAGAVILLFHQGGSNARGEYGPIIPRLLDMGYNILATDQRSGGQYYGQYNRTLAGVADHTYGEPYTYCDAYNNLEGALNYILSEGFTGPKILWGSSYSAALVIQMGSKRPDDIAGVLAFSPASGDPMEGCNPFPYLETIAVPLLIVSPPSEMNREGTKRQFELAAKYGHKTFTPEHGVHGSSMLVESRVGHDVSKTWEVVSKFLSTINN